MGEVKVIGAFPSLPSFRVEWALNLKGVEYECITENLLNKSPMLLKYNPVHKKVPVLLHDGKPIAESLVILEYIDETWKENPLLPQDPYERAMARFWARFVDEKCLPAAWGAMMAEGEAKKKAVESALETLKTVEEEIKGKKFFGGDRVGYLDLVVGWIARWLPALEQVGEMKLVDAESFPCLHQWIHNFVHAPVIKDHLPPLDKVVDYFQRGKEYLRSLAATK